MISTGYVSRIEFTKVYSTSIKNCVEIGALMDFTVQYLLNFPLFNKIWI